MTMPSLHLSREERAYVRTIARDGAVPSLIVTLGVSVPPAALAAYGFSRGDSPTTLVALILLATTQLLLRVYLKPKRFVLSRMLDRLRLREGSCPSAGDAPNQR